MDRDVIDTGRTPARDRIDGDAAVYFPALDPDHVEQIGREVDRAGYCRIDGIVPPALLAEARDRAEAAVRANGGEYVALTGPVAQGGYLLSAIHADPAFARLLRALYAVAAGGEARRHVHQVLRCLQGETARRHADYLHYDSYAVTILIPLAVPREGLGGDLLLLPNNRPIRRSYLANGVEKLLLDRGPVQRWLWRRVRSGAQRSVRLTMLPGSVYIFWGCRSLHANTPSDPGALRATLLYHYGNPHGDSPLRRWRVRRSA